ncbi:MAG: efflux RND transporter periplasmic adaptor subunit [Candidatus Fimenecus sp.]
MEGKKKFLTKKKIIAMLGVAVIVVAGAVILPNFMKPPQKVVTTQKIETSDLQETVNAKGDVKGSEEAKVYAAEVAKVQAVYVKEGDHVTKGQLLAQLDSGDLGNQYAKASQQIAEARRKLNNAKSLYEAGALPQNDYMEAQAAYNQASLALGDFDFSKSRIVSPISGTVTRSRAIVGSSSNGTGGEPLFTIENLDSLKLSIKVREFEIGKINLGQTVTIKSQTLGDITETGIVTKIYPSGETREGSQEKVIPVEISVTNNSGKLIAGTTAKAEILIKEGKKVKTVPVEAVIIENEQKFIYLLEDGKVKKVEVKTGIEGIFRTEIKEGKIKVGDKVIIPEADVILQDGEEVVDKAELEQAKGKN